MLLRFPCTYTTLKACCKRTACRVNITKFAKVESWEDHVKMYTEDGNFVNIERSAVMLREHNGGSDDTVTKSVVQQHRREFFFTPKTQAL
jgi:hypothetical protein